MAGTRLRVRCKGRTTRDQVRENDQFRKRAEQGKLEEETEGGEGSKRAPGG